MHQNWCSCPWNPGSIQLDSYVSSTIVRFSWVFYSLRRMAESSTLKVGDRAPDFTLAAANRDGTHSLRDALQRGPALLEFLRGTW